MILISWHRFLVFLLSFKWQVSLCSNVWPSWCHCKDWPWLFTDQLHLWLWRWQFRPSEDCRTPLSAMASGVFVVGGGLIKHVPVCDVKAVLKSSNCYCNVVTSPCSRECIHKTFSHVRLGRSQNIFVVHFIVHGVYVCQENVWGSQLKWASC